MKKKVFGRRLSRGGGARKALFRSLIRALVTYEKIKTTKAKAKAIQAEVDKIINLAKEKTLSARREVLARLGNDRKTADMIFEQILPGLEGKNSGFTRLVNLPPRRGDAAEMVRMEWVGESATVQAGSKSRTGSTGKSSKDLKGKSAKSVEKSV